MGRLSTTECTYLPYLPAYAYRLLCVREWFVGGLVCVDVCGHVPSRAPRPPLRGPHSVTPSGQVCTSGPCRWMCAHKGVLFL